MNLLRSGFYGGWQTGQLIIEGTFAILSLSHANSGFGKASTADLMASFFFIFCDTDTHVQMFELVMQSVRCMIFLWVVCMFYGMIRNTVTAKRGTWFSRGLLWFGIWWPVDYMLLVIPSRLIRRITNRSISHHHLQMCCIISINRAVHATGLFFLLNLKQWNTRYRHTR